MAKHTTSASFTVVSGRIILNVCELTYDFDLIEHQFDVDPYALPLAANFLNALNEQAALAEGE